MADGVEIGVDSSSASAAGSIIGTTAGQGFIKSVSEGLPPVVGELAKSIFGGLINEDALSSMSKAASNFSDVLNKGAVGWGDIFKSTAGTFASQIDADFQKAFSKLTDKEFSLEGLVDFDPQTLLNKLEGLGDEGLTQLEIDLDLKRGSLDKVKGFFKTIGDFADPFLQQEVLVEIGIKVAADKAQGVLKGITEGVGALEKPLLDANRRATQLSAGFFQMEGAGSSIRQVSDSLREYRERMTEAAKQTGLSEDELFKMESAFSGAGVAVGRLDAEVGVAFGQIQEDFRGTAAAAVVFKGAGIEAADGAQEMAFAMRNLGLDSNEALERVGLFSEVAARTTEPIDKVREVINQGARSLKFYGDTTKGVAEIYDKFLQTVGQGKEGLAAEFVKTISTGIGGMNEGLKAFLGQVSGIGGGQGAIGGMLEVEEQIASGNIQGVLDAVTEQIETISGANLMTRQEAIGSGQQEQFFLQRKLLQEFGFGGGSDEEANRLLENLATGQEILAADLNATRGTERVAAEGEQRLGADLGLSGRAQNVADVTRQLGLTQNVSVALAQSSGNFRTASEDLFKSVDGLKEFLEGGLGEALKRREESLTGVDPDSLTKESGASALSAGEFAGRTKLEGREAREAATDIGQSGRQKSLLTGENIPAMVDSTKPGRSTGDLDFPSLLDTISQSQTQSASSLEAMNLKLAEFLTKVIELQKSSVETGDSSEITLNVTIDPDKAKQQIIGIVQKNQSNGIGARSR